MPSREDQDRLQKWACENLVRFNKAECEVWHLGQGSPIYIEGLEEEPPKIALSRRSWDPGGLKAGCEPAMCSSEGQLYPG